MYDSIIVRLYRCCVFAEEIGQSWGGETCSDKWTWQ